MWKRLVLQYSSFVKVMEDKLKQFFRKKENIEGSENSPSVPRNQIAMEEMRTIAKAYYDAACDKDRKLYKKFFNSMKPDAKLQVRLSDFLEFMKNEGHLTMSNPYMFNELDKDRSGGLDQKEVMTLYYIIKSGRPFCGQCGGLIAGLYFTCMACFNHSSSPFSVCLACYQDKKNFRHSHGRKNFLDNFAQLEVNRKSALARARKENQNDRPSNNSTSQAIVTYSQSSSSALEAASTSLAIAALDSWREHPWRYAFKAFEAGLHIANLVSCTIM